MTSSSQWQYFTWLTSPFDKALQWRFVLPSFYLFTKVITTAFYASSTVLDALETVLKEDPPTLCQYGLRDYLESRISSRFDVCEVRPSYSSQWHFPESPPFTHFIWVLTSSYFIYLWHFHASLPKILSETLSIWIRIEIQLKPLHLLEAEPIHFP